MLDTIVGAAIICLVAWISYEMGKDAGRKEGRWETSGRRRSRC